MKPRLVGSHVRKITGEFETDKDGHLVRVITVETDLVLDVLDPRHDKEKVDKLLANLQASMGDIYDKAVLKQARDG